MKPLVEYLTRIINEKKYDNRSADKQWDHMNLLRNLFNENLIVKVDEKDYKASIEGEGKDVYLKLEKI